MTALAEWSKVLVGPGSQLATCNIIFSFFFHICIYLRSTVFSCLCELISVVFFWKMPYRASETDRVFVRHVGFFLRSIVQQRAFFMFPCSLRSFAYFSHTRLSFKPRYALMDDSHTRSTACTQSFTARFLLRYANFFDLCV